MCNLEVSVCKGWAGLHGIRDTGAVMPERERLTGAAVAGKTSSVGGVRRERMAGDNVEGEEVDWLAVDGVGVIVREDTAGKVSEENRSEISDE